MSSSNVQPVRGFPINFVHPVREIPINCASSIERKAVDAAFKSFYEPNSKFNKWLDSCIDNELSVRCVNIDAVTMFGPNIGFMYFTASVFDKENNQLPGTVFLRGDSATCLLIIEVIGEDGSFSDYKMVVVEEVKVPVSKRIMQSPAGMMDLANNLKGKIIDEVREETGIVIENELEYYKNIDGVMPPVRTLIQFDDFWPSQGGCDENIKVFAYIHPMSAAELAELNGKLTGNADEHEIIKVHVLPLSWETIDSIRDSKLLIAASKFDRKFPGFISE